MARRKFKDNPAVRQVPEGSRQGEQNKTLFNKKYMIEKKLWPYYRYITYESERRSEPKLTKVASWWGWYRAPTSFSSMVIVMKVVGIDLIKLFSKAKNRPLFSPAIWLSPATFFVDFDIKKIMFRSKSLLRQISLYAPSRKLSKSGLRSKKG